MTMPTLATAAMLVYVRLSVWSARKLDRKQTIKTIAGAGATNDAARVNKHLLANSDAALKEVQRKADEIRKYVDANTLPWDDAGNRILPNDRALVVVGDIHRLEQEFYAAVDDFVREYPVLRAQAITNLGDMGENADYPQPDIVRTKFSIKVSFNPIPEGFGDVRQGMTEQQAAAWQAHFEGNVKTQVKGALTAAWQRLRENLQRYSERLSLRDDGTGKTQIFRDTMIDGLRETTSLLASLNVFGDAELVALTHRVRSEIAVYDGDQLRASATKAAEVKANVDDVLARMKELLGD